ncbi:vWA domain-containing protein [Gillisia sp. Hel_I_29]|uniref:vWA domain-containing protein n=1 Tax=Gillisia sp. Hel_I_29 TaxID=1249975 RepID=UPI000557AC99|nr:vWA domain-containing protein [Gillisia sp. Hel_I_29]
MSLTTILFIALAAIFALGFVFFKYFYSNNKRSASLYFLSTLSFISIFTLLLLLINPKVVDEQFEIVKPRLDVLVDNSLSIAHLKQVEIVSSFYNKIIKDKEISEKFELRSFSFGESLNLIIKDSLRFQEHQTNINKALLEVNKTTNQSNSAIVLITDGNQTVGEDYSYFKAEANTSVYPIIVGDTTSSPDLFISNLNVNKYTFLNNEFPVELIINYSGENSMTTTLTVTSEEKVLKSQIIQFNKGESSKVISLNMNAKSIGTHIYKVSLEPISEEKNFNNNIQNFALEVIDERTSILIVSSVLHPDLGMLKRSIESNPQRKVKISSIEDLDKTQLSEFELVILYQPNNLFKQFFEEIEEKKINNLLITGVQTDWGFLNSMDIFISKAFSNQNQDYQSIYNNSYSQFQFDDIDFNSFPPLEDKFGRLNFKNRNYQTLLFKAIDGIEIQEPLLFTFLSDNQKHGILLGENIWKWRTQSFVKSGDFKAFDTFFGKFVQYLSSTSNKKRLDIEVASSYKQNEDIQFSALYFDKNFQFDAGGELNLKLINNSGEILESAMVLRGNEYVFNASQLPPGAYSLYLNELQSGLSLEKSFTIIEYNVEEQFTSADINRLKKLAHDNLGVAYTTDHYETWKHQLLKEKRFVSVQKSRINIVSLINWKILLTILILSLGIEWFTRKYIGLI